MFLAPSFLDKSTREPVLWVDLTEPGTVYADDCTELKDGKRILRLVKSQIAKRAGLVCRRGLMRLFGKERLPVFELQTPWFFAALGLGAVVAVRLVARLIVLCVPKLRRREARASRSPGGKPGLRWRFWSISQGIVLFLAVFAFGIHLWSIRDHAVPEWHGGLYFVKSAAPEYKAAIVRQLERGETDWSYYGLGPRTERAIYDLISYPGRETVDLIKPHLKDERWEYREETVLIEDGKEPPPRRRYKLYPVRQTAYLALKLLGEEVEQPAGYVQGLLPAPFFEGFEYLGIFPSEDWTRGRWQKLTEWPPTGPTETPEAVQPARE